jgi:hypothetical protein
VASSASREELGHVFGPNDFLRKQIKAEGEKTERR